MSNKQINLLYLPKSPKKDIIFKLEQPPPAPPYLRRGGVRKIHYYYGIYIQSQRSSRKLQGREGGGYQQRFSRGADSKNRLGLFSPKQPFDKFWKMQ